MRYEGGDQRIPDGDSIEGLKVVHEPKHLTILFEHTEPALLVSCGGWFIHTRGDMAFDNLYGLILRRRWDRNVSEYSWCMGDK